MPGIRKGLEHEMSGDDCSYVYVLWSEKLGKLYIGSSSDPCKRVRQHNARCSHFTARGIPWVLRYWEGYETMLEARRREKHLKSGAGRVFLRRVFNCEPGYPEIELPANCVEWRYLQER